MIPLLILFAAGPILVFLKVRGTDHDPRRRRDAQHHRHYE